jgi:acetyl esterase/lipase
VTTRRGWRCYELTPRGSVTRARPVVYWHGGCYVFEIQAVQWWAAARIAAAARVPVTVPLYPLAPLSTAADTVATATGLVGDLTEEHGGQTVTVMGDSAGGGLALAVAQQLRDQHRPLPRRVVLISPWLDVALSDPEIAALAPYDVILQRPGLVEAGRIYAGPLDVSDPRVSPLYGGLTGLPPVTVVSGTHEIVHPDACRLVDRAAEVGVRIDHIVLPGGQHCYPLQPIREGVVALRQLARLV